MIKFLWSGMCLYGCSSASYLLVCLHLKWFFLIREEIKMRVNHLTNVCVVETTHSSTAERRSDSIFVIMWVCCFYFDFLFFLHLQSVLQGYN